MAYRSLYIHALRNVQAGSIVLQGARKRDEMHVDARLRGTGEEDFFFEGAYGGNVKRERERERVLFWRALESVAKSNNELRERDRIVLA